VTGTRETFVQQASTVDETAVVKAGLELNVDTHPLTAYAALTGRTTDGADTSNAFLLESAGKTASSDPDGAFRPASATPDRHARYSFVGYDPEAVVTVTSKPGSEGPTTDIDVLGSSRFEGLLDAAGDDAIDALRGVLPDVECIGFENGHRQRLDGGLVGFLSYDAVYDMWLDEVGLEHPESTVPDAQFVLTTRTLVFDEVEETVELVCTPLVQPEDDPEQVYDRIDAEASRVENALDAASEPEHGTFVCTHEQAGAQEAYEDAVRRAKEHVLDGDIYQGVISRTRERYGEIDSLGLYAALREINPSPYMYHLSYDDRRIVGASPETLVSVRGETVMVNPIAGTCPRGSSPVEDRRLAGELLADEKERAEHTMLVDLGRNDVRRVAEPGSVRVEEFMNVLKYSHVQHIESTVTAELHPECDAFDATRATFPAGTLTGAPKIRAMEIIDELEQEPRGLYGGGVGYFSWTGDADFAIVIRTATIEDVDQADLRPGIDQTAPHRVRVRAGAGLVADSDPAAEYEETESKMDGVLAALDRIERDGSAGDQSADADTLESTDETSDMHAEVDR
jgi:anthranilate synthase component 1